MGFGSKVLERYSVRPRNSFAIVFPTLCTIAMLGCTRARGADDLEAGRHIRVQTVYPGSGWIEGQFLGIDRSSLLVRSPTSTDTLKVSLETLFLVEVRHGHGLGARMGVGASAGVVAGALVGAIVGGVAGGDYWVSSESVIGIAAAVGAGAGLVLGAIAGAAYVQEYWEPVPRPRVSFVASPVEVGLAVGVVLRGRPPM